MVDSFDEAYKERANIGASMKIEKANGRPGYPADAVYVRMQSVPSQSKRIIETAKSRGLRLDRHGLPGHLPFKEEARVKGVKHRRFWRTEACPCWS